MKKIEIQLLLVLLNKELVCTKKLCRELTDDELDERVLIKQVIRFLEKRLSQTKAINLNDMTDSEVVHFMNANQIIKKIQKEIGNERPE